MEAAKESKWCRFLVLTDTPDLVLGDHTVCDGDVIRIEPACWGYETGDLMVMRVNEEGKLVLVGKIRECIAFPPFNEEDPVATGQALIEHTGGLVKEAERWLHRVRGDRENDSASTIQVGTKPAAGDKDA